MTRMGRQMISALLAMAVLLLLLLVCATVCRAVNLSTRADYETALYYMIHADVNNADWDTLKLHTAINMGITLVEGLSKKNEIHDTVSFAPGTSPADTSVFYALSTSAASGGVLNVLYLDEDKNELVALTKREIEDFGKDQIGNQEPGAIRTYMFAEFHDTIMVYPRPDIDYTMHVYSYKISNWLSLDTSSVGLPLFYRVLALEMAYGYACVMTGTQWGFERYQQIRNNVLSAIYAVPPAVPSEVQTLGLTEEK